MAPGEAGPAQEAAPPAPLPDGGAGSSGSEEADLAAAEEYPEDGPPVFGGRESEDLHPVSLTDLFAADPECAAAKPSKAERQAAAGLARSHAFAGAGVDDDLELKKLQVFVRIRPSVATGANAPAQRAAADADAARENCVHATSRHSIVIAPPEGSQAYKSGDRGQTYSFTRVYDRDTPQEEYYEATGAPLVRDLLRNPSHNSVMMAYGITAAGKTYTIEGTKESPGVLPRALVALFQGLAAHVEPVVARAAYYEVYNEQIFDLLDTLGVGPLGHRAMLKLKEDEMGRVFVAGLSEVEVGSAEEALAVLRRGSRQRQRAETGLNYNSSRSHSIFTVTLYQQGVEVHPLGGSDGAAGAEEAGASGEEKLGRMSFVDLAGSERAQRTGNVGVRLKESVAINSSLMTLGRCLEALRWNQQHKGGGNLRVVPYRESKVTHLFRDALHGWGQVVLSVNVSPVSKDYDETAHVLKYAALATQIGTIQQAEAPRRTIKAVSPAIRKVKRKAALPPEARRQAGGGGKAKKAKKVATAAAGQQADLAAIPEAAEAVEAEASLELEDDAAEQPGCEAAAEQMDEQHQQAAAAVAEGEAGGSSAAEAEHDLDDWEGAEEEEIGYGTPGTPMGAEDEVVAALQAQVQQLIVDLQKAEERCVLLETEVREEVADEMSQLLRDMEESYRVRLDAEVEALERKAAGGGKHEAGGKRGGRGGRGAASKQQEQADAEELAAARSEAAQAEADAEEARQEIDSLAAQLAEAQAEAEQQSAAAAEHAASLAAEAAAARQQVADVTFSLVAEQQRAQRLDAELATARQQAQAELAAAQQQCTAVQDELAAVRQRSVELEADLAGAQQRSAELEAELAGAQQRSAELEAELAAAQQRLLQQEAGLTAAQQETGQLEAGLVVERQRAAAMEAELATAQQQVQQLQGDLAAVQQRSAEVEAELAGVQQQAQQAEAELAEAHAAAHSEQQEASVHYEAQLQEAVTQLEANKGMELEMAEEQCERLRKENMAVRARLQGALAALAACGSPAAGPASLAARMAQVASEGQGRGAGGTPHDVALARARQAAAADDLAAAAAAAGTSTAAGASTGGSALPRSRSRFAEEAADGLCTVHEEGPADAEAGAEAAGSAATEAGVADAEAAAAAEAEAAAAAVAEVEAEAAAVAVADADVAGAAAAEARGDAGSGTAARLEAVPEEAEEEVQAQPAPRVRGRGRAKKAVAFAGLPEEEEVQPVAPGAAQPSHTQDPRAEAAAPQPAAAESRRARRMTRSATVAAPLLAAAPAELLLPAQQAAKAQQHKEAPQVEAAAEQPAKARRGRRHTQAPAAAEQEPEGVSAVPLPVEAQQSGPEQRVVPRGRKGKGKADVDKENAGGQAAAGSAKLAAIPEGEAAAADSMAAALQEQQAPAPASAPAAGKGGKRRKRLQPSAPVSAEMREALGELEVEGATLLRQASAKKLAEAAGAGGDAAPEGAGGVRRSRRQTQFYRL